MRRGGESGQAVSEYALLAAVLLLALLAAAPGLARAGPALLDALDAYLEGFRFAWSLPVP